MFLPPATSTSGSPATGSPGGSTTRVSICHKSTRLWQCHTFCIATVHSRLTTTSFERSRTSCLRSASTRTCNQCTNRFTLASYCCTYRIQDNKARISHYEKKLAHLLNVTGILCISSKTSCAKSSAVGLLFFCQSLKPCSRLHLQFCLLAATTFKVKNAMGRYRGQCDTMLIFFKGFLTYCSGTQVVWQNLKSLH